MREKAEITNTAITTTTTIDLRRKRSTAIATKTRRTAMTSTTDPELVPMTAIRGERNPLTTPTNTTIITPRSSLRIEIRGEIEKEVGTGIESSCRIRIRGRIEKRARRGLMVRRRELGFLTGRRKGGGLRIGLMGRWIRRRGERRGSLRMVLRVKMIGVTKKKGR
uniref:Uncharacterized protein n=1 Tax=Opuntia streptacantha TaxID=393608 RepID=A0A7C9EZM6_OPUST